MFEYPKTLIKLKISQSLNFGEFCSSWKVSGCVKLVAAKVIRQHMFFFT